jgi:hypothetical protein
VDEDFSDDRGLVDESQELHRGIASGTGERVDLVNTVNELGPPLGKSAPGRCVLGFVGCRGRLFSVGGSNAIGVSAIEMDQVLVGLWDMDEHPGQKLERVESGVFIDVVPGFGLVEDELGVRVIAKSREVDGRAHQIARQLVEPFDVGGIDGGAIVDAEARMPP